MTTPLAKAVSRLSTALCAAGRSGDTTTAAEDPASRSDEDGSDAEGGAAPRGTTREQKRATENQGVNVSNSGDSSSGDSSSGDSSSGESSDGSTDSETYETVSMFSNVAQKSDADTSGLMSGIPDTTYKFMGLPPFWQVVSSPVLYGGFMIRGVKQTKQDDGKFNYKISYCRTPPKHDKKSAINAKAIVRTNAVVEHFIDGGFVDATMQTFFTQEAYEDFMTLKENETPKGIETFQNKMYYYQQVAMAKFEKTKTPTEDETTAKIKKMREKGLSAHYTHTTDAYVHGRVLRFQLPDFYCDVSKPAPPGSKPTFEKTLGKIVVKIPVYPGDKEYNHQAIPSIQTEITFRPNKGNKVIAFKITGNKQAGLLYKSGANAVDTPALVTYKKRTNAPAWKNKQKEGETDAEFEKRFGELSKKEQADYYKQKERYENWEKEEKVCMWNPIVPVCGVPDGNDGFRLALANNKKNEAMDQMSKSHNNANKEFSSCPKVDDDHRAMILATVDKKDAVGIIPPTQLTTGYSKTNVERFNQWRSLTGEAEISVFEKETATKEPSDDTENPAAVVTDDDDVGAAAAAATPAAAAAPRKPISRKRIIDSEEPDEDIGDGGVPPTKSDVLFGGLKLYV